MSKRTVFGAVLAFVGLLAVLYYCALPGDLPASEPGGDGLAGTYTVNGVDPLGVEYSGTVVIVEQPGSAGRFDIEWIVTGAIQRGEGRKLGTTLQVTWGTTVSGGGTGSGTAIYEIGADGRLVGTRAVDGFDTVGTEEIFPDP